MPGPRRVRRRTAVPPVDIQQQLKYRSLATAAALEWKRLTQAGRLEEAEEKARETIKWEAEWHRHGGTGHLFK